MIATRYFVDGVDLDDEAWRWRLLRATALPAAASRRVSRLEIQRLDGVRTRHGGWGPGSLRVVLFVPYAGVKGAAGSVESRLNMVQSLLARAHLVVRQSAGLPLMQTKVVSVALAEPVESSGRRGWELEATLELQPFWVESPLVTSSALPVTGEVVFADWAGTTGDVQDGILRVKGPLTRCSITAEDGTSVSFTRALTSAQFVFIDVAAFRAWAGGQEAWEPTGTPVLLDWPPAGPLRLIPTKAGIPLTVTGEGFTTATGITLRARRWYL